MDTQEPFQLGNLYTRKFVSSRLGGGEINFLPRVKKQVVCGCFTLQCNPEAPYVVIPGSGPEIEFSSEIFCSQDHPIPVFLRRRANGWEYMGQFQVMRSDKSKSCIDRHHFGSKTPIAEISRVIFLERCA